MAACLPLSRENKGGQAAHGTRLTPQSRARLEKVAFRSPGPQLAWLENGWLA